MLMSSHEARLDALRKELARRDLQADAWVVRDIGVAYRDECLRLDVYYRREDAIGNRLGATESVGFRLTLATLGEPIYGN